MAKKKRKDKRVGSAQGKRRYDLPLNKSVGTGFLVLLIALMTFLAVMAVAAAFAMNSMTERWSSGLENRLTIEIPAEKASGLLRTSAEIEKLQSNVVATLRKNPQVANFETLQDNDIQDLISPWLGDDIVLKDIPLPGLISVELQTSSPEILGKLEQSLHTINADIRLDTHESWLGDLLRLTGALQFSALLITVIIGVTTVTAVAGAIRSRMAIHREDVELLHLMGASDLYIGKQFQRHALIMALQGSAAGMLTGIGVLATIGIVSGDTGAALLPDFSLSALHILCIIALPAASCLIAGVTARFTVLRVLALMP